MFLLHPQSKRFTWAGLGLAVAQFWLFIFALPPFEIGIWMQTEPVMVAEFAVGALDALWLLWGMAKGHLQLTRPSTVFFFLYAWVGWQTVVTLLASNPHLSWFGPAEMGEGTGWHLVILLQALMLYPLWQYSPTRTWLLAGALLSLVPQGALHAAFPQDTPLPEGVTSWAPGAWGAYLAFMAAPLWLALVTTGIIRTSRSYAVAFAAMLGVLVISFNKSASVLYPLAIVGSWIVVAGAPRLFARVKYWRYALIIVGCTVPLMWIEFSMVYPAFPDVENKGFIARTLGEKDGAMSTRLVFNKVGMLAMDGNASRWWLGDGWGHYRDDLYRYVLVDGVHVYEPWSGTRSPNWFMVDGYAFHSHNQPLEALLSLGIVGMILWFAVPVAALLTIPEAYFWGCAPLLVAQMILGGVWFALPQCMPYAALGWVVLMPREVRNTYIEPGPTVRRWGGVAPAIAALVLAGSAMEQWSTMMDGETLYQANHHPERRVYSPAWIARDMVRGGEHLREVAGAFAGRLQRLEKVDEEDVLWLEHYMVALDVAAHSPKIGPQVAAAYVEIQNDLRGTPAMTELHRIAPYVDQTFPEALVQLAKRVPQRDDLATPYLLSLYWGASTSDREARSVNEGEHSPIQAYSQRMESVSMLRSLLEVAPHHRGALWVLGGQLQADPNRHQEGITMQQKALALGVDTIYPITMQERQALMPAP